MITTIRKENKSITFGGIYLDAINYNDAVMIKFMLSGSVYIYGSNISSVGDHQFNITYLGY